MNIVPEIIFIVPYRNREVHREVFMKIMPEILEGLNYGIFFIHQNDKRPFNRGAVKNLGFKYVKKIYPLKYKNITLVFNDIDCMAYKKNQFSYQTNENEINHFYGFKHTLGGIFSIKAKNFEEINGFANIWTWGLEDNILLKRVLKKKFIITRTQFIDHDKGEYKKLILLRHENKRLINRHIVDKFTNDNDYDGINSITNIKYGDIIELKNNIYEINIINFDIPEKSDANYVKNSSYIEPYKYTFVQKHKLGSAKTFGKQIDNKNFMLF